MAANVKKVARFILRLTLWGIWSALYVTSANEQDRAQVQELAQQVQQITGESVKVAFVDQGYTGEQAAEVAAEGIQARSSQTSRGEERVCAATATLGGGA